MRRSVSLIDLICFVQASWPYAQSLLAELIDKKLASTSSYEKDCAIAQWTGRRRKRIFLIKKNILGLDQSCHEYVHYLQRVDLPKAVVYT